MTLRNLKLLLAGSSVFSLVCLFTGAAISFSAANAFGAQENGQSQEQLQHAKDLPGTVVVRIDDKTGEASVLELSATLEVNADNVQAIGENGAFQPIQTARAELPAGELDQNSSSSSWYAWYNYGYFYRPTYYYWGYRYTYSTYYTYNWYGYSYYWYRWW